MLLGIAINIEGKQMFLEYAAPTDQILYRSICDQFDIPRKEADRLKQIFTKTNKDVEQILKDIV